MANVKKLLKKIKGLFIKNKLDLDNDGKIESYKEEIQGLFSEFHKMSNKLGEVIGKLGDVVEDEKVKKVQSDERIAYVAKQENDKKLKSDERIAKAEQDLLANKRMQDKLQDFII